MYLSHLLIDVGSNPDRPRPGRLWLRNIYHVHQRLCMAFPSDPRKEKDRLFLKRFVPADFAAGQVNVQRKEDTGFLYRIDPHPGGSVSIIVLSALEPDWDYAFGLKPGLTDPITKRPIGNAGCLLAAPPKVKNFEPPQQNGQRFRFRIRINLSKKGKVCENGENLRKMNKEGRVDRFGRPKDQGKRISLTWDHPNMRDEVIQKWFEPKCERSGFRLDEFKVLHVGWVVGYKPEMNKKDGKKAKRMPWRSALIEGCLTVTDPEKFRHALVSGIGSAKAFGFGLLSLAQV